MKEKKKWYDKVSREKFEKILNEWKAGKHHWFCDRQHDLRRKCTCH